MPKKIRPFWISADVEGRKSAIGFGPASDNGGFFLRIQMKENGQISDREIKIYGNVKDDCYRLEIHETKLGSIATIETPR